MDDNTSRQRNWMQVRSRRQILLRDDHFDHLIKGSICEGKQTSHWILRALRTFLVATVGVNVYHCVF